MSEFNDVARIEHILAHTKEREIAAVLLDPIMSNAGIESPSLEFPATLRSLCDGHVVVLIFDEVIAGFRIARGGAAECFGVRPDLSVFGKAIAGGFTQSAVVGRADLIDQVVEGVVHAGTFNGNPIAMAAVEATLRVLSDPTVYVALDSVARTSNGSSAQCSPRYPRQEAHATWAPSFSTFRLPAPRACTARMASGARSSAGCWPLVLTPSGKIGRGPKTPHSGTAWSHRVWCSSDFAPCVGLAVPNIELLIPGDAAVTITIVVLVVLVVLVGSVVAGVTYARLLKTFRPTTYQHVGRR